MKLVWETARHENNKYAQSVVEELCDRLRALSGAPVRLVVIQAGLFGGFTAAVVCRARRDLTWIWLAYDCLTEPARRTVRLKPYTTADAKRDVIVAELLRAHLGWKPRGLRR